MRKINIMENQLKECPFCSSNEVELVTEKLSRHGYTSKLYYAQCKVCKARGSSFDDDYSTTNDEKEKAVTAWNRRTSC